MSLVGVKRLLRHRWWVLAMVAVVGAVSAYVLSTVVNSTIRPSFEAVALVPVVDEEAARSAQQDSSSNPSTALTEAVAIATDANAAVIDSGRGSITGNSRTSEIEFKGRARTESGAMDNVESMRNAYLDASTQATLDARQQRLNEIIAEAELILAQMEELQPSTQVDDPPGASDEDLARLDVLESLISGLTSQLTKLEIDLILAKAGNDRVGSPTEVQEEIDLVNERLGEARAEVASITAKYSTEELADADPRSAGRSPSVDQRDQGSSRTQSDVVDPDSGDLETTWTLEALQERYDNLQDEYQELFSDADASTSPELAEPTLNDLTRTKQPVAVMTAAGAIVGTLLATVLLVADYRARRKVYSEADLRSVPVLATLPLAASVRRLGESHLFGGWGAKPWDLRMSGIKQLRTHVAPSTAIEPSLAVGLTGSGRVAAGEVRQLAIDLSRRFAAADHKVLLIDLDFEEDWPYATLARDLDIASAWSAIRSDRSEGVQLLKRFLAPLSESGSGSMVVLRSGRTPEDPADVYMTDSFSALLDVCRESFDVLLAVLPRVEKVCASTLPLRFRLVALAQTGRTTQHEIDKAARSSMRESLIGTVLLTGNGRVRSSGGFVGRIKQLVRNRSAIHDYAEEDRSFDDEESAEDEITAQAS